MTNIETDPIPVAEAERRVAENTKPLEVVRVSLQSAAGRWLAQPVSARHDSPPFDTSAMDGYAVRTVDCEKHGASVSAGSPPPSESRRASAGGPAPAAAPSAPDRSILLRRAGEVAAGSEAPRPVRAGEAIRINTGAPLPAGADAVVRIEDTTEQGEQVLLRAAPKPGQNIRRRGEDFRSGQTLLNAGLSLSPRHIALLASLGYAQVAVRRRPSVALLISGDELTEPGQPLQPGRIFNSNGPMLREALTIWGAEVHELGSVSDNPEAVRRLLAEGLQFDVLVTTGGVSMGSYDFIRPALLDLGAEQIFWKVRQRPGKPLFFARHGSTLCFALPGNPVSAYITALLYIRPALLKMQGAAEWQTPWQTAAAGVPFSSKPDLTVFARVSCTREGTDIQSKASNTAPAPPVVRPLEAQGSHQITGLAVADGIVRIDEGAAPIGHAEALPFLPF